MVVVVGPTATTSSEDNSTMNPEAKVEEVWEYLREAEDKLEGVVSKYNALAKTAARLERKDVVREILLGEMKRDAHFREIEAQRMRETIAYLETLLDYERANSFRKTKALKSASPRPPRNDDDDTKRQSPNDEKLTSELKRLGAELETETKRNAELTSALEEWMASYKAMEEELATLKTKLETTANAPRTPSTASSPPLLNPATSTTSTLSTSVPSASVFGGGSLNTGEKPPKVVNPPSPAQPSPQLQEMVAKVENFFRGAASILSKL